MLPCIAKSSSAAPATGSSTTVHSSLNWPKHFFLPSLFPCYALHFSETTPSSPSPCLRAFSSRRTLFPICVSKDHILSEHLLQWHDSVIRLLLQAPSNESRCNMAVSKSSAGAPTKHCSNAWVWIDHLWSVFWLLTPALLSISASYVFHSTPISPILISASRSLCLEQLSATGWPNLDPLLERWALGYKSVHIFVGLPNDIYNQS